MARKIGEGEELDRLERDYAEDPDSPVYAHIPCRSCWGTHPYGTACPGPADSGFDML